MSEKHFSESVKLKLQNHFEFIPEIKGSHFSGNRFKLDYLIIPKNRTGWKNQSIVFGLEFKDLKKIDGDTKNYTKWLGQCIDYSNTNWDNYGFINILTCPGIRDSNFMKSVDQTFLLVRILGQLGIGELKQIDNYGWTLTLNDHRIWSEKKGVECGEKWDLQRKFGSR